MKPDSSTYRNKSGFQIPEDYFSDLEDRIMDSVDSNPQLVNNNIQHGFGIPENYFNTVDDKILTRLEQENKPVRRLIKRQYLYYAAAVIVIAILAAGSLLTPSPQSSTGWDNIEVSAMENYLDEGYDMDYLDLSNSEYAEFFNSGTLFEESDLDQLTSEAVMQYLDENVEDPIYIIE